MPAGRVLIAFSDGPLVANPTWTRVDDQTGATFPLNFVSGFDTQNGRQTLMSQTETGTATVYINDYQNGIFDPRNSSSPYFGELDGRQIMLQIYNPVTGVWEPQFRGLIEDVTYDIDDTAVNANGEPVNASVQIECVDMFDYLNGYGLTPGLDGVAPPSGMEDGVYYAATSGTVEDRILEILTDATSVGWVTDMTQTASGNTEVIAVKYDPDESALTALRDAADAELPFIANIYVNRHGQFVFRGRYSRFDPDAVKAAGGGSWDFTRWKVGDSKAITADATRAQMRVLSYVRGRSNIINAAICYPQGITPTDLLATAIYADTSSITSYGKHAAAPMGDLLTDTYVGPGTLTPGDGKQQCSLFAKLLVKNQKDPREAISALNVKSLTPVGARASVTWDVLTKADISHIVNVAVSYPYGTGFTGSATVDDYYIEGRSLKVRPANSSYDYVELDLEVSPAVWSMDTHSVFPAFGS